MSFTPNVKQARADHKPVYKAWISGEQEQDDWEDGVVSKDEAEWYERWNHHNRPDAWEEFTDDWNKKQWRLKDEYARSWWDHISAEKAKINWKQGRLPKREYYERLKEIEEQGLHDLILTPQRTGDLYSLKVEFPPGFKHLSSEHAQQQKAKTDANYHISLMYANGDKDPVQTGLRKELGRRFRSWDNPRPIIMSFPKVKVWSGSGYGLEGNTYFDDLMEKLAVRGAGARPHISLD